MIKSLIQCPTFRSKYAFTLAEVLITLGIIGVVAAMTLPSLIVKTKEKEAVSKLKKVHSTLENAYRLAQNEHSEITNWFSGNNSAVNSELFYKNLKPYLKVMKECGFEQGCLTEGPVKTLDGRNYVDYNLLPSEYKIILADGVSVVFFVSSPECSNVFIEQDEKLYWNACGNIKVDINGKKGEYTLGKDFFTFDITPKGIIPSGTQDDAFGFERYCNVSMKTSANGRSCAAWVIYNENMDYLHCDDLSWNGKKKYH